MPYESTKGLQVQITLTFEETLIFHRLFKILFQNLELCSPH